MPDKPRRRWFRFSLRTLMFATALVAMVAGWVGNERAAARRQAAAAVWLEAMYHTDAYFGTPFLQREFYADTEVWYRRLLSDLFGVRLLKLSIDSTVPPNLSRLVDLGDLQTLQIRAPMPADLTPLARLSKLQMLGLSDATDSQFRD